MPKAPCDSTFFYLFKRVKLEQVFSLLRQRMLIQIEAQEKDFEQLIRDGKSIHLSSTS